MGFSNGGKSGRGFRNVLFVAPTGINKGEFPLSQGNPLSAGLETNLMGRQTNGFYLQTACSYLPHDCFHLQTACSHLRYVCFHVQTSVLHLENDSAQVKTLCFDVKTKSLLLLKVCLGVEKRNATTSETGNCGGNSFVSP